MRIGHTGHRIGHPRSSGHHGNAEPPAQLGIGVGHIHSSTFIANIDNAGTFGIELHPDGHDVSAA